MIVASKKLSSEVLNYKIDILRKRMVHLGLEKGLNHEHTVEISQLLDFYLSEIQSHEHPTQHQ